MSSPTQRALQRLRKEGYRAAVVEKWNPHAKIRQDLFGFIDILAVREGKTLAVQATSASNHASRIRKLQESEALPDVLNAGWAVEVWSFRKPAGKRTYELRRDVIT